MKQFFKLIVLMLIGLALSGCYSSQQEKAIEMCRKSCKYPFTFEVIDTFSILVPDHSDTMTFKVCYTSRPATKVDTIVNEVKALYGNASHLTGTVSESFKIYSDNDNIFNEESGADIYNIRIDSIYTYTTSSHIHEHTFFKVTYSYKNDYSKVPFKIPHQDSHEFLIINDRVLDNDDWWNSDVADDIETIDTISVNCFINNSPDKIFKSEDEVKEYLNNFESNFKLKN